MKNNLKLIIVGSWVLVIAGFGHFLITFLDLFLLGPFSPPRLDMIYSMQNVSINLVSLLQGSGSSVFESLWGAYIGFNFSHGLGVGFLGLIHILLIKVDNNIYSRHKNLLPVSILMSLVLLMISICFYFYVPTVIIIINLSCLSRAYLRIRKLKDSI